MIFIVATPENDAGVVSKSTDNMPHFLFNIGKEVLDMMNSILIDLPVHVAAHDRINKHY